MSLERDGFALLPGALDQARLEILNASLTGVLTAAAVRESRSQTYAARNLVSTWPDLLDVLRGSMVESALRAVLGDCGLVRAQFLDKPPGRTWTVGWHKDMTIAVTPHESSDRFRNPTVKAGVPHVEAPVEVLDRMLAVRIHLDPATEENGPLVLLPGSHRYGKGPGSDGPEVTVLADQGDVLLMRPLVSHRSDRSRSESLLHRRVLHLEFAERADLEDGFEWHDFVPL